MPGKALSSRERDDIAELLRDDPDSSWAQIGRETGRHPTTVAREVKGNGGRRGYRPASADRNAVLARRRPKEPMWAVNAVLRERIIKELRLGRSPVAIWADSDFCSPSLALPHCPWTVVAAVVPVKPADPIGVRV